MFRFAPTGHASWPAAVPSRRKQTRGDPENVATHSRAFDPSRLSSTRSRAPASAALLWLPPPSTSHHQGHEGLRGPESDAERQCERGEALEPCLKAATNEWAQSKFGRQYQGQRE